MVQNGQKILVVDDDQDITNILDIYLKNEGYDPIIANDGSSALTKLNTNPDIALILLDIMMPGMDGKEVIKEVRKESAIPVIFLTAKTDLMDKLEALSALGANDYVTKPFNELEVMARVRAQLRTASGQVVNNSPEIIDIGSLVINKDSHEVKTPEGETIDLTALEFSILYLLASNLGKVFAAEQIFERVWQTESVVSAKTVMVHVSHLRDKIKVATGEEVIQTVWGVGYKVESEYK